MKPGISISERGRIQRALMNELVAACFGDKEKAIRLIEYERKLDPTLKTMEATEMALDRLCYDRGKGKRAATYASPRSTESNSARSGFSGAAKSRQGPPDVNVRMVLSMLLACAVVFGFIRLASRSLKIHVTSSVQAALPAQPTPTQPPEESIEPAPMPSAPLAATPESAHAPSVFKCIVNGQTVYSDSACGTAAATKRVVLADSSSGFASPPKERLEDLTAKRVAAEQAYQRTVQAQPAEVYVDTRKVECDRLGKHIEWLDALARVPQSGQSQDWIRTDKARAQTRQFDLHC